MASAAAQAAVLAMDDSMKLGAEKGVAATNRMMASLFNKKGATYEALKLSTKLASAKTSEAVGNSLALVENLEGVIPAGELSNADAAALKALTDISTAAGNELNAAQLTAAMKSSKGLYSIFHDLDIKAGQAIAKNMLANVCLMAGEPKDAIRAANEALIMFREIKSKKAQVNALHTLISASVMKRDIDGALVAAKEIVEIEKEAGEQAKHGLAMSVVAKLHLANDEASLASKAAEEAMSLSKAARDMRGQVAAMSVEYEVNLAQGKPSAALRVAQEVVSMSRDKSTYNTKMVQASAQLMAGDAQAASKDSLDAAMEAVRLFKDVGDKEAQAAALISLANARFAQERKAVDEGLQAAQEAASLLKGTSKAGEAMAVSTTAVAYMLKPSSEEAEKAAREALSLFREAADPIGEAYAMTLLKNAKMAGIPPSTARLLIDNSGCAHIELNEMATQESLEAVIATLHGRTANVNVIVLHLEGRPGAEGVQSYAVTSGTFIMGLRTLGLPVICACWGKIAGPAWGLVLCSDYRIAATTTSFMLPVWGPPETLGDLIGHQLALDLCMQQGPSGALVMLAQGIIHQCQKGKEDTRKAASEMAKRISACPSFPVRQTMNLMTPSMERYALAAAKGNVRW
eukprot:CAMPEP_0179074562 /NCGR_PEP_ID=MMETSP0796-20121207/33149_1 /TAXON_ID=73915 /ORGANISM="Pyrodinium bahamense, Strain pbaha01" /LENGTH=630 /DNA_ID=CAMNT_0020771787 /DNA_START=53 /DNA_END=1945 /DNA_ORIENTATION=-